MSTDDTALWNATLNLIDLLVDGKFEALEQISKGQRLTAGEMRTALQDYGGQFRRPPTRAAARFDIVQVANSDPVRWSIRCDLWTVEEGATDLTLEATLYALPAGTGFGVEIDDIHVL